MFVPSPPNPCPLISKDKSDGGLEMLILVDPQPSFCSPPNVKSSQRTWEPYYTRVVARRDFGTSSDVSPLWRAIRLGAFDLISVHHLSFLRDYVCTHI